MASLANREVACSRGDCLGAVKGCSEAGYFRKVAKGKIADLRADGLLSPA